MEPGIHQFLPFDLTQPTGEPYPIRYWALHIRQSADCYVWGKDTFFPTAQGLGRDPDHATDPIALNHYPRDPSDLVLNGETVAGMHFWRDRRSKQAFISDDMLEALRDAEITGFAAHQVNLVGDAEGDRS